MRTRTVIVSVALVVTAVAAVPVAGLAATGGPVLADHQENGTETSDGNASVAPGERLSGVVGLQEAELEGEVDERAFGLKVARAATNESRADVAAQQFDDIEQRLAGLEQRLADLEQARANGSMSEGKYRAEVTELAARTETATVLANQTENATRGLPADLLESKGIEVDAIQRLREQAGNLTGPEVAEIARSIAGPGAAPGDRGPDERPGQDGSGQDGPPDDRPGADGADGGDAPDGSPADGSDNGQQDGTNSTAAGDTPTPDDAGSDGAGGGTDRGGGDGGAGNGDGGAGSGDDHADDGGY